LKQEATGILAKFEQDRTILEEDQKKFQVEKDKMQETQGKAARQNQKLKQKVESLSADRHWLIEEGFKHVVSNLHRSAEYLGALATVQRAAHALGLFVGLKAGYRYCSKGRSIESISYYLWMLR
jgi:uncharacterized protein (DUF3084 family)